ncbi:hypothetical protein LINPERHAP2_LOCUS4450 [Linum perenne]
MPRLPSSSLSILNLYCLLLTTASLLCRIAPVADKEKEDAWLLLIESDGVSEHEAYIDFCRNTITTTFPHLLSLLMMSTTCFFVSFWDPLFSGSTMFTYRNLGEPDISQFLLHAAQIFTCFSERNRVESSQPTEQRRFEDWEVGFKLPSWDFSRFSVLILELRFSLNFIALTLIFFFIALFFLNFFTRNRSHAPSSSSSSLCSSVLYCGFTSRDLGSSFVVVRFSWSPDFLFFVSNRRLAKSKWRNKILLKPCLSRNSLRVTASTPPTKNSFKELWEIWSECQSQKFGLPIGDVYLITKLKKKKNGSRIDRFVGTSGGSWHRVDKDFTIKLNCSNSQEDIVGVRKKFSYRNLGSVENKCWILSEYSISFDGAQSSTAKRKFVEVDHSDATGDGEADGDDFYIDEILALLEDKAEPECNAPLEEVQSPMRQISQVPLDPYVASDFCLENDDPFSDLQDLPLPDFYKF